MTSPQNTHNSCRKRGSAGMEQFPEQNGVSIKTIMLADQRPDSALLDLYTDTAQAVLG